MQTQAKPHTTAAHAALPPGPAPRWAGLPLMRAMREDYLGYMSRLQQRWGDVVYQRLLHLHDYSFFHPEQVRELLVAGHERLIRWERGTEVFASAHGQSVLVAEGAPWKRQRQMLQPGFSPKRVEGFAPLMVQAAQTALRHWEAQAAQAAFPFEAAMTQLTMDVILRSLFSRADVGASTVSAQAAEAVHVLGVEAMAEMYWPANAPLWAPWKAAKRRALRTLEQLVRGELARRQALPEGAVPPEDLLQMLLGLRDEQGQALDEQALRDECMTIFLAGHETSASALSWWGWCMAAHPEAQARAAAEVQALLGEGPRARAPHMADLAQLPWLQASLKEALRLYPPGAALFTRRLTQPLTVAGYELPPGALLRLTPWVMQRDPRWFQEPAAFRPERFDPACGHPEIPRGAWMPFGVGPRVCLGSHFALTEMGLIAALILQRYELQPLPGAPAPRPVLNITLRPEQPLQLVLKPRWRAPARQ